MRGDKSPDLKRYDEDLSRRVGVRRLIGIDEAGRGSLAGPVVVSAVSLDYARTPPGLDDSKKIPASRREPLAAQIESLHRCAVVVVPVDRIESVNILGATMWGMLQAVRMVASGTDRFLAIVDGPIRIPELPEHLQTAVVKADAKSACVAAASIVAKVRRDALMDDLAALYPGYSFEENKGYGSPAHIAAIRSLGLSPVHRASFCRRFLFGRLLTPPSV